MNTPQAPSPESPQLAGPLVVFGITVAIGVVWLLAGGIEPARTPPEREATPTPALPDQALAPAPTGVEPAAAQTAPGEEGTAPAPAAPPAAAGPAPWDEVPPAIRGVGGVVTDAVTGAPIPGAWITWRLPTPQALATVLENEAFQDPRFRMVSDAAGRFRVDRLPDDLPVSSTLFAVAPGYAFAATVPGLRREVAFALEPMGTLVIERSDAPNAPPPLVRLERADGQDLSGLLRALPPWGPDPLRYGIPHLPPGPYRVRDGARAQSVQVPAGGVARVTLTPHDAARLSAAVAGPDGPLAERALFLVDLDADGLDTPSGRIEARTDRLGRVAVDVPPGRRYAAFLRDGKSERRLQGLLASGAAEATLTLPALEEHTLELTRGGAPLAGAEDLGLVALDAPHGSLLHLEPDPAAPGRYALRAAPGRYGLFEADRWWGELELPRAGPPLALEPRRLEVTWTGLDPLAEDERVRGRVTVLPVLLEARPDLVRRFAAACRRRCTAQRGEGPLALPLGAAGHYRVEGESDLGPFEERVQVDAAQDGPVAVEVRLTPE